MSGAVAAGSERRDTWSALMVDDGYSRSEVIPGSCMSEIPCLWIFIISIMIRNDIVRTACTA